MTQHTVLLKMNGDPLRKEGTAKRAKTRKKGNKDTQ